MSMPKKEYIRISLRLDKDVAEALEKMANETGITKTAIIEKSVMQFVDNYNNTGKLKQKKNTHSQFCGWVFFGYTVGKYC